MPMPIASPAIDIRLSVMPAKYIITKVVTTLITIERAVSRVGRRSFKKMNSTTTASNAPHSRFSITVLISWFVYSPSSYSTENCKSAKPSSCVSEVSSAFKSSESVAPEYPACLVTERVMEFTPSSLE